MEDLKLTLSQSSIAQLVEYATVNRVVPGSSPGGGVVHLHNPMTNPVKRLISWDKRMVEKIQNKFNLSGYQMLCIAWLKGIVVGIIIGVTLL